MKIGVTFFLGHPVVSCMIIVSMSKHMCTSMHDYCQHDWRILYSSMFDFCQHACISNIALYSINFIMLCMIIVNITPPALYNTHPPRPYICFSVQPLKESNQRVHICLPASMIFVSIH
jgi:hypothetical protein